MTLFRPTNRPAKSKLKTRIGMWKPFDVRSFTLLDKEERISRHQLALAASTTLYSVYCCEGWASPGSSVTRAPRGKLATIHNQATVHENIYISYTLHIWLIFSRCSAGDMLFFLKSIEFLCEKLSIYYCLECKHILFSPQILLKSHQIIWKSRHNKK